VIEAGAETGIEDVVSVLTMSSEWKSPEEKFLLLRVVWVYPAGNVEDTVAQIAGKIGLSEGVVRRARDQLVRRGILEEVKAPAHRRTRAGDEEYRGGRFRKGFRVAPEFLEQLNKVRSSLVLGNVARTAIHSLLCAGASPAAGPEHGDKEQDGEEKRKARGGGRKGWANKMLVSNRLLLALLWSLADEYGVVRGRGAAEISRLAGMTPPQLRRQLAKLLGLKFLWGRVPGISKKTLFGKTPGAIYLSMAHPLFWEAFPDFSDIEASKKVFRSDVLEGFDRSLRFAERLARHESRWANSGKIWGGAAQKDFDKNTIDFLDILLDVMNPKERQWLFQKAGREGWRPSEVKSYDSALENLYTGLPFLHRAFQGSFNSRESRYIKCKICEYACDFLNRNFELSDEIGSEILIFGELLDKIKSEAVTDVFKELLSAIEDENEGDRASEALVLYIYFTSINLAIEVENNFPPQKEDKYYLLMPSQKNSITLDLLFIGKNSHAKALEI